MEKGKRIEIVNLLPEAMIQHIQSFLSGKDAARTTILSKSWYSAWLTRSTLDFNEADFHNCARELSRISSERFHEYVRNTVQRYQDMNLKIESFKLRKNYGRDNNNLFSYLIVNAMKMGVTDLELNLPKFILPREVLESKTLVKLSLSWCDIDGNHLRCSRLKSLSLNCVNMSSDDVVREIISCCISIEEFSMHNCTSLKPIKFMGLSRKNLHELHKLRSLFLDFVYIDSTFFTDFASRFPCLKDLSLVDCYGHTRVQIASTSLQHISFRPNKSSLRANFDVPNIRKFTYECFGLPPLSINAASREWELDISIMCNRLQKRSWFLNLKKLLTKYRLSKISLSLHLSCELLEHEVDIEVVPKPLVLENLTIDAPSTCCCALLVRLFGICRPKFITHYWTTARCYSLPTYNNESLGILWKRLMKQVIEPSCGIPDQNMFGQFDLKEVNVELYQEFVIDQWQPVVLMEPLDVSITPLNKRKIRFQLKWG